LAHNANSNRSIEANKYLDSPFRAFRLKPDPPFLSTASQSVTLEGPQKSEAVKQKLLKSA
jgi:hypothetical protein